MRDYPVELEVHSPAKFERVQLFLRLALAMAIGFVGVSVGWLSGLLYFALPVFAAIALTARGRDPYLGEIGDGLGHVLRWVIAFDAYMLLVVDRFPVTEERDDLRLTIHPGGHPTVGTALLRLVTSIPAALVLGVLSIVSCLFAVIGGLCILFAETQPGAIVRYQRGVVRWQARLFGYHASLVEAYPPFEFDGDEGSAGHLPVAQVR